MMLVDMGETDAAYEYAREKLLAGHFVDDGEAMGMLAEKIVTDPAIDADQRDLDFALEAAKRGRDLTTGDTNNVPGALATLALVQYHRGDYDEAVQAQKRAYFLARRSLKGEFRRVLKTYQQAEDRLDH
jgi:hypothetical protein